MIPKLGVLCLLGSHNQSQHCEKKPLSTPTDISQDAIYLSDCNVNLSQLQEQGYEISGKVSNRSTVAMVVTCEKERLDFLLVLKNHTGCRLRWIFKFKLQNVICSIFFHF